MQMNGLVSQVMNRTNVPDRSAAGTHENRMGDRFLTGEFYARQQGAIADAGGAE